MQALHEVVRQSDLDTKFSLALVCFDPLREELVYISCGKSLLYHLARESNQVRLIENQNPLFSTDPSFSFDVTRDRFEEGDQLAFIFGVEDLSVSLEKKILETRGQNAKFQANELLKVFAHDPNAFPICCSIDRIA